jgi:hypothetical protein
MLRLVYKRMLFAINESLLRRPLGRGEHKVSRDIVNSSKEFTTPLDVSFRYLSISLRVGVRFWSAPLTGKCHCCWWTRGCRR